MILDSSRLDLGEGHLWHPLREELFWFDITSRRLLTQAACWVSNDGLLIAEELGLFLFDPLTGACRPLVALEADKPVTRSNDGRADPQGGFWIGTIKRKAEPGAGSIWCLWQGETRLRFTGLTIPNAICFAPDGRSACFNDTVTDRVQRVALDAEGWPVGQSETWLDLTAGGLNTDGAVIDAAGVIWLAAWGAAYAPQEERLRVVEFGAPHTSLLPGLRLPQSGAPTHCRARIQRHGRPFLAPAWFRRGFGHPRPAGTPRSSQRRSRPDRS